MDRNKKEPFELNIDELSEITLLEPEPDLSGSAPEEDDIRVAEPVRRTHSQSGEAVVLDSDPDSLYKDHAVISEFTEVPIKKVSHIVEDISEANELAETEKAKSSEIDLDYTEEDFLEAKKKDEDAELLNHIARSIANSMEDNEKLPTIDLSETFGETGEPGEDKKPLHEPEQDGENDGDNGKMPFFAWLKSLPVYVIPTALFAVIGLLSLTIVLAASGGTEENAEVLIPSPTETAQVTEKPVEDNKIQHINPVIIEATATPVATEAPEVKPDPRHEEYATNILVVGKDEAADGFPGGQADLIMLATVNSKTNEIVITSIMRDWVTEVEGRGEMKISEVYSSAGINGLMKVVSDNLLIVPDGYVEIGYEAFRRSIDSLGGIDIEITEEEADYLNKTNYISNEENRTVARGVNHLNGDQALGYTRIRNVGTSTNEYGDFGRTSRAKKVVSAIMQKMSKAELVDLYLVIADLLPLISTDVKFDNISSLVKFAYGIGLSASAKSGRIPVAASFRETKNENGSTITISDMKSNVRELHIMVFGDYYGDAEQEEEGPSLTMIPAPNP